MKKILIVGAGLSGSTLARLLAEADFKVTIIDKRDHIGGNCHDYSTEDGTLIHKYGPHIFHTNNEKAYNFLSRFTDWIPYKHKVKGYVEETNKFYTIPTNFEAKEDFTPEQIKEIFYERYTKKMWGLSIDELNPSILKRVLSDDDHNEYYFPKDEYQFMPKNGYTSIFEKMLNHDNIEIKLETEYTHDMNQNYHHVFNSMPIDEYYNFIFGELPYRSIKFYTFVNRIDEVSEYKTDLPVTNFTNTHPTTRITFWNNFPNSNGSQDWYTLEEPCDYTNNNYERYYPVKDIEGKNKEIYQKYRNLEKTENITFIGRCGTYTYIDMDQAVNQSIQNATKFINENRIY